jgi:hypothetical protein
MSLVKVNGLWDAKDGAPKPTGDNRCSNRHGDQKIGPAEAIAGTYGSYPE